MERILHVVPQVTKIITECSLEVLYMYGVVSHMYGVVSHMYGMVSHMYGAVSHMYGAVSHMYGAVPHMYGAALQICPARLNKVFLDNRSRLTGAVQ